MKNNKGFSLVELIIVIAIMAVLVGVLAPTYLQYVEKSKKSNDVSTVDSIINAIETIAVDPEYTKAFSDLSSGITVTLKNGTDIAFSDPTVGKGISDIVGTDVQLKSSKWDASSPADNTIEFTAVATAEGKVSFSYTTAGANDEFSAYATSITKIPAVPVTP